MPRTKRKTRCLTCGKEFFAWKWSSKFCSISCGSKSHKSGRLGTKNSEETKDMMSITRTKYYKDQAKRDEQSVRQLKIVKQGVHNLYIDGRTYDKERTSNMWQFRLKSADSKHTIGEWETLKAQYNFTCPGCGIKEPKIKLGKDHIVALSSGGSNNIENIQPLCARCNLLKGTKTIRY